MKSLKAFVVAVFAVLAASLFFVQTASALSCDGYKTYPAADDGEPRDMLPYFSPQKVGSHQVRFYRSFGNGSPSAHFYWRRGTGAWNYFTSRTVTTATQTVILYAGSTDISFKVVYNNNYSGSGVNFRWTYCTA